MSSLSKRKFYRTIIQIEVLSETPYSSTDLEKINSDITHNGNQVGTVTIEVDSEELGPKLCAERLKLADCDPGFFYLNIHGHDTEDAEDYLNEDDEDEVSGPRKLKKD